ncbi:low temperature requirement protein LtrA [Salinibacterium sp. CAN_S4]|uniref:low temperature requirement protein A n=1 Tax=Salinibacterium sp. CAN_S4 TaxID=2787727 RepID=UPI0018EF869C
MASRRGSLLREEKDGHYEPSPVELLFDLVFVFAATRLSLFLVEHLDVTGLLEAFVLLLAVWWFWDHVVWTTNWFNPDKWPVRLFLFAAMALGLVMSTSILGAFEDLGVVFVVGYLGMHALRAAFIIVAGWRDSRELALNMVRASIWVAVSSPLWIIGAVGDPEQRVWWWLAAIALNYLAPAVRYWLPIMGRSPIESWAVSGHHISERARLFVIIALGESVLVMGFTFAGDWAKPASAFGLFAALVGTLLLWLIYFNNTAGVAQKYFEKARESGRVAANSYTYLHLLIVAGIVLVAVGDELVLAHPDDPLDPATAAVVFGGPALYILGNLLFKRSVGYRWLKSHIISIGVLIALFVLTTALGVFTPLIATWLANAVMLAVVIGEEVAHRRSSAVDASLAS